MKKIVFTLSLLLSLSIFVSANSITSELNNYINKKVDMVIVKDTYWTSLDGVIISKVTEKVVIIIKKKGSTGKKMYIDTESILYFSVPTKE